jgi:hypothetical protein
MRLIYAGCLGWAAALAFDRVAEGRYGWACVNITIAAFYAVVLALRAPSSRPEER